MYILDLKTIYKLEKKYKGSTYVSNILSRLVDMSVDGIDINKINDKGLNINMLLHLNILKEEKTNKKKKSSKK